MATQSKFQAATARAAKRKATAPTAVAAKYDQRSGRIVVDLSSRLTITFAADDAQGLQNATTAQLSRIEISPNGFGLHFPLLDADLYLPALLEGFLGSRKWMAARLGAKGGRAKSEAKASAARANGTLGGRPRKRAS